MSSERSDALVLRTHPWSETSLVVNFYTREFGKLSMLAKGARRPKSSVEGALDLLSICHLVFISKGSDALDIVTEAKLAKSFKGANHGLLRLYCGYYLAELLDRFTDKGERQPELYDLAIDSLAAISQCNTEIRTVTLRFELQMLRILGQLPTFDVCAQCGNAIANSANKTASNWDPTTLSVFSLAAGGALCEKCQVGGRQTIRVGSSVLIACSALSIEDWRSLNMEQSLEDFGKLQELTKPKENNRRIDTTGLVRQHRAGVRGVMNSFITAALDRKPRLHAYLEELGR